MVGNLDEHFGFMSQESVCRFFHGPLRFVIVEKKVAAMQKPWIEELKRAIAGPYLSGS